MKKIIFIFVIAAIVCTISGCKIQSKKGGNTTTSSSTNQVYNETTETVSETKDDVIIKLGETVTLNDFEIAVDSAEIKTKIENSQYTAYTPDDGNVYIVVNITVKNIDKNASTFLPIVSLTKDIRSKLLCNDYEFTSTNLLAYSENLHDTFLNPLSSKSGVIAFSVSEEIADLNSLYFVLYINKETCTHSLLHSS